MRFRISKSATLLVLATLVFSMHANAQPTKLLVATLSPADSPVPAKFYVPWAASVQEQSQGALEMDIRNGGSIANLNNSLDRLKDDVVQITHVFPSSFSGSFPLFEVGGLPFMTLSAEEGSVAMWRVVKSGLLDDELKDVYVIATGMFGYAGLHLVKAPRTLDDFRGLKVAAASRILAEEITLLGAAPTTISPEDAYTGLQRGAVDGVMSSWAGLLTFKLDEVTRAHVEAPFGTNVMMVVMMRSRYNALPEAARKALDANSGENWTRLLARESIESQVALGRAQVLKKGQQLVEPTPTQLAMWKERTQPVIDDWIGERPKGGAKVVEMFRAKIAEVHAGR